MLVGGVCDALVISFVVFNTFKKSKLKYLYLTSIMYLLSSLILILTGVLYGWSVFCWAATYGTFLYNSRCPILTSKFDNSFSQNVTFAYNLSAYLQGFCYFSAHWLFSFRYFEVAEMLGRANKSNEAHIKARKITSKISVTMIFLIGVNYIIAGYNCYFWDETDYLQKNKHYSDTINTVTFYLMPTIFLLIDCVLLLIALIWICRSLKHSEEVMGNERWMALHTFLLTLTFISQTYVKFCLYWYRDFNDVVLLSE
jgi:hypothetical protein